MANNLSSKSEAMIDIIFFHQFRLHQLNSTRQVDSAAKRYVEQISINLRNKKAIENRGLIYFYGGESGIRTHTRGDNQRN